MTREELFKNLKAGARWDVGVSINRSNSLPLDANSIFESYAAAAAYASKDATRIAEYGFLNNAYIGQIIAVIEDKTVGEETVTTVGIYYIDANLTLQPVGKEVVADGNTIVNDNGTIKLYGFDAAATATYPRKTADGKIEWVTVQELVEGATENTVTVGDNVSIESVKTDTGYTVKLKGIDGATNGQVPFYVETITPEGTTKALAWKDVYTKAEIDNKITGIMSFRGIAKSLVNENKDIVVAGSDGDVTITAAEANRGHVYIIGDKEYISTGSVWEELGFSVDLSGYYTKGETDSAISTAVAAETERAESAENSLSGRITTLEAIDHTKYAQVSDLTALEGTVTTLSGNLTTLEGTVNEEKGKLSTLQGTVSTLGETVDGHTDLLNGLRTDVDEKVATSVYNEYVKVRTYTDTQIDEKIAALKVTEINQKIATLDETLNGTTDNPSTGLVSKVANLTSKVDTNIADIKTINTTIGTLTEKVSTLEGKDTIIEGNITALQTVTDKHTATLAGIAEGITVKSLIDAANDAAATAKTAADQANTAVTNLKTQEVATNTANISNLSTRVTTIEGKIDGVTGAMHFIGVKESIPTENTGYKSGDVILVNKKEYVFDGSIWVELGDEGSYALRSEVYTKTETDAAIVAAMSWTEME